MAKIILEVELEGRRIKGVGMLENETDLPDTTETVKQLCFTIFRMIQDNPNIMNVEDLLNELGIPKEED